MSKFALQVCELAKTYYGRGHPPVRAVDGMSFAVRPGQVFGLLGPNGAGKATLLKVLTTLIRPTSGRDEVMGCDAVRRPLDVRRQISMMLQETAIEMWLTARGQHSFACAGRGH